MEDNHRDLIAHRGPHFEHWRARCRAAFGVFAPLDDTDGDG